MNIVFVITSSDKEAKGGHFRSCLTIARSLKRNGVNVRIINIGVILSPVFQQNYVEVDFVKVRFFNFPFVLFSLYKKTCFSSHNQKLLAFDFFSFFYVRILSSFTKTPSGYFRCGGTNLNYFPFSKWIFCFSQENYSYIVKRFTNSNIYLFPNRIEKISSCSGRRLRDLVNNNYPIILRVGRFVSNYTEINKTCLNLSSTLNSLNIPHNMIFIGYGNKTQEFLRFKNDCDSNPSVLLLTEKEFTENASNFLPESFLVVGTGRGAMEAIVEGRLVAVYSRCHNLPVLLESFNILEATSHYNFSLRNILGSVDGEVNKERLINVFLDNTYSVIVTDFIKTYRKLYDIDEIIMEYIMAFRLMKYDQKIYILDFLKHFFKMFLPKLALLK